MAHAEWIGTVWIRAHGAQNRRRPLRELPDTGTIRPTRTSEHSMAASTTSTIGPVEAFWRYRTRTVTVCVLFGLLGAVGGWMLGGKATATTEVYLTDPRGADKIRPASASGADLMAYTNQRAQFAASDAVLTEVSERTNGTLSITDLRSRVTTTPGKNLSFTITCTSDSSTGATSFCRSIADVYEQLSLADNERRRDIVLGELQATRDRLLDEAGGDGTGATDQLDVQIAEASMQAALFGSGVEFIDVPVFQPTSRLLPAAQFGLAAAAFGALIAGALAWLAALRRPVVAAPGEAATKLRSVLLGQLDRTNPQTGYDLVATNAGQRVEHGIVVVTASSDTESGNTDLVVHLADAWIHEGRSVLVIDGNVHRPRLSMRYAAGPPRLGFTDLMGGLVDEVAVLTRVQIPNGGRMNFVPCGRPVEHPSSLLRSVTAQQTLARLRQRYDIVLIDAPPIMERAEGGAIASVADGVLVVVPGGEQAEHLDALRNRIEVLGVSTYGVVYDLVPA